ncbi:hypothetical protein D0863_02593 [Hortaea werneckii]|uniref:F-box domain-containing protein n=1 Tax=Hortaea werneckii TaxID=91943 RepID=A0A3M7EFK9_HORWE|nr:hypothetical protein D0863_02593 [Hortaea werneckii]
MVKRSREEDAVDSSRDEKRLRTTKVDRFSRLSDELILRVLSYLPVSQLVVCQRLSYKYRSLAGDGQIWKEHYYNRFVRPRASRLPGLKEAGTPNEQLSFASKASRWLEDEHLVGHGTRTNWKRQYKLRHNWTQGSCAVDEIEVAEQPAIPPILVQMHNGIIYMADHTDGLRAWGAKGKRKLLAQLAFPKERSSQPPTTLAVDTQPLDASLQRIIVGYQDGAFSIFELSLGQTGASFHHRFSHEPSSSGVLSAVALSWPYAVTMTATQRLSLYRFSEPRQKSQQETFDPPRLLHSLKSHTVWPPLSTSLRTTPNTITVSIAYAQPTYLSGWTVGIQEVKVSSTGTLLESRLASAIDQHYRPLAFAAPPMMSHLAGLAAGTLSTSTTLELRQIHSKPTSLSYTHPYLLVSHPDNTLTLYLVTSTAQTLSISAGSRLWGHTSSVSGAHVGGRGKAVSVSKRGDELRVWELEGGFASSAARRRLAAGDLSVQIRPEFQDASQEVSQAGIDLVNRESTTTPKRAGRNESSEDEPELTLTRGWIGFDEENVVVLKEHSQGKQALVIYDFT